MYQYDTDDDDDGVGVGARMCGMSHVARSDVVMSYMSTSHVTHITRVQMIPTPLMMIALVLVPVDEACRTLQEVMSYMSTGHVTHITRIHTIPTLRVICIGVSAHKRVYMRV